MLLGVTLVLSASSTGQDQGLIVVAIGDAGDNNRTLRATAATMTEMLTGVHDGGVFDYLLFLGDNFYETGLNVPVTEVDAKIRDVLGPFREVFDARDRSHVHAIPGNHDYYRKMALETSALFGLVSVSELPVGLTGRGNERAREIPFWTYHAVMPASILVPISPRSDEVVEIFFVDSALPLRTAPASWSPALDSLARLLRRSAGNPRVAWRVLAIHHPMISMGEHGGYSVWNDETRTVEYLTNCDKDSNAVSFLKNWLDPQDLCAERYRAYVDSLTATLHRGRAGIHVALAGHDHSLQLLNVPPPARCPECPGVHVISGAGSRPTRVASPRPPAFYSARDSTASRPGLSEAGFVQMTFTPETLRLVFFSGKRAERIDMGEGATEFHIDRSGRLRLPGR
jgi:hypothetical protein